MSAIVVAFLILLASIVLMLLGYNLHRGRMLLMSIGFYTLLSGVYAAYSNWLPQVRGEVPEEAKPVAAGDIESMSTEKLAEMGEIIIFGKVVGGNPIESDVGKGQCPLCHRVSGTNIRDRAPDLTAAWDAPDGTNTNKVVIGKRGDLRIKDPKYLKPDTVQTEANAGSGRATTAQEYIAESHVCPNCFVVAGFGVKGTDDRESPMPQIHKPPIALTIEELIAVDTYLYVKDGLAPPAPRVIRASYEKFIPEKDRIKGGPPGATQVAAGGLDPQKIALPGDTPEQIVMKMQCFICHQIPTIAVAKFGVIGPLLIEGHNASQRLASPEFQARFKAGKTKARTPKEYVMESIMNPNAHIVPAFVQANNPEVSPMLQDFATKFTFAALEKMADFLLTLNCDAAMKDGLKGPPQEPFDKVCGPATKTAEAPVKTTQRETAGEQLHARANMMEEVR